MLWLMFLIRLTIFHEGTQIGNKLETNNFWFYDVILLLLNVCCVPEKLKRLMGKNPVSSTKTSHTYSSQLKEYSHSHSSWEIPLLINSLIFMLQPCMLFASRCFFQFLFISICFFLFLRYCFPKLFQFFIWASNKKQPILDPSKNKLILSYKHLKC